MAAGHITRIVDNRIYLTLISSVKAITIRFLVLVRLLEKYAC